MGILSVVTLGMAGRKPPVPMWTVADLAYLGVGPDWSGHKYVAELERGAEKRQLTYHFHTHKDLRRVRKLVQSDVRSLNDVEAD